MKLTLCIPMYNEKSIIEDSARTLSAFLSANFSDYELLFADDGSTDGSADAVKALNLPNTRVIAYTPNRGKGFAVRTAMLEAAGDIAMFIDADLAYGTNVVRRAYDIMTEQPDKDILIGSRAIHPDGYKGYTFVRRVASKLYIKFLCSAGGFNLSDSQCGCKAFRKSARQDIFSRCRTDGFAFDFEVLMWAQELGYSVVEMPVQIINHKESKISAVKDTFGMLREFIRIKKYVGSNSYDR